MKGIVITTSNIMFVRDFGEPLHETLGEAVGGYIEHVRPMCLVNPYCLIVNEEGLLKRLPGNRVGSALYGTAIHGNPIFGNVVIMKDGVNEDGEQDIVGLDDSEIERLTELFKPLINDFENLKAIRKTTTGGKQNETD